MQVLLKSLTLNCPPRPQNPTCSQGTAWLGHHSGQLVVTDLLAWLYIYIKAVYPLYITFIFRVGFICWIPFLPGPAHKCFESLRRQGKVLQQKFMGCLCVKRKIYWILWFLLIWKVLGTAAFREYFSSALSQTGIWRSGGRKQNVKSLKKINRKKKETCSTGT